MTATKCAKPFAHLRPGQTFHVVRAFIDYDQMGHPVGECWSYLGHAFLPYEDGLTLFVALPDGRERRIRLQWRAEAQGEILDRLDTYLSTTPPPRRTVRIALTRDSVCMGDDVDAPHDGVLEVDADADVHGIAEALLAANYLAHVGSSAVWAFEVDATRVTLGFRDAMPFVEAASGTGLRAADIDHVHVRYSGQAR